MEESGRRGIGKERDDKSGRREGGKKESGGWRRKEDLHVCTLCKDNISVHPLYSTIQNIASVPSHPPKRSGRKCRGKKPVEGMNMVEVNVCVSLEGVNPTLQFN